jgi:hypothetical protein
MAGGLAAGCAGPSFNPALTVVAHEDCTELLGDSLQLLAGACVRLARGLHLTEAHASTTDGARALHLTAAGGVATHLVLAVGAS